MKLEEEDETMAQRWMATLLMGTLLFLAGCVIVPARPAEVWVPGHYEARTRTVWVPGHYYYR
jgi:hypothetical protein